MEFSQSIKNPTQIFFGSSDKLTIIKELNERLALKHYSRSIKEISQNPRTLSRLTIINNFFNPTDYYVSKKIDGYTAIILCIGDTLYGVIDRFPDAVILKEHISEPFASILEGEYVESLGLVVLHDIITEKSDYSQIYDMIQHSIEPLNNAQRKLTFTTKTVRRVQSAADIEFVNNEECKYHTDGLIFTNHDVRQNSIYKWKPKEQLTVDLVCLKTNNVQN
jgi:predicted DNA-binding protein YlxM (UPF0122 family)